MKKHYINYADDNFKKQQKLALKMARKKGCFDNIQGYSRNDIDDEFYKENKNVLDQSRGSGYWLWKSYFINKKLSEIDDGDYLFYSDSGAFFLKSVDILIEELEKHNQDIMCFELPLIESQWTKKELFLTMECDDEELKSSNQIMGGFHLIKKRPFTVKFYNEFLRYCCDELNITDKYDVNVKQDGDFINHRHDQSILSLLYKKYKLRPFKDATQFGENPLSYGGGGSISDFAPNKLYTLKNGRKFRYYDYPENYKEVLMLFRGASSMKKYFEYRLRQYKNKFNFFVKLSKINRERRQRKQGKNN